SDYESGKPVLDVPFDVPDVEGHVEDRKSTRLNSSHVSSSYAVICSKKKKSSHCKIQTLHSPTSPRFPNSALQPSCTLIPTPFLLRVIISFAYLPNIATSSQPASKLR